ncbi:[protein-PII] uridylyltransferase [Methylohalomonas lacus]|uniref:Bifunctional uridylyltransferase/uridylyl-removing enzyme n=1 Tax=Methylohalomonas lacus TaxID=398773 RepID=A0AAE3L0R8_9GAMM|nr:[protein-PII] uridylyltransferase [Methylohalomonas lacus]MCS3902515.1 [protein-PII] uridylyltransferase [Methylohalomonas lacus]
MWDTDVTDRKLFDATEFAQRAADMPHLQRFKEALERGHDQLREAFAMGTPIKTLVYKRAWFIDQVLAEAWALHELDNDALSLVAVGGYGRGELHPASDIDIMLLTQPRLNNTQKEAIERFLTFLWDIGLEVGHSVRTVKECVRESKNDITVTTNMMESRRLAGNADLYRKMRVATGPDKIWPTRKFFEAKLAEQVARHHKYDDSAHNLEPNIKESPGGLRDIQMIGWVAKRHFGAEDLRELVDHGFLTRTEFQTLNTGLAFLWRVRFALHTHTGRRDDRLLFDYQKQVAAVFGYHAEDNSAVEQFMKMYFRTIKELSRLNEMLLQHFQEAIIYARRREKIRPLNKRFQMRNDFIEVTDKKVFEHYPFALLELFLLIQQEERIQGVRASTIRLVRESLDLIDDDFRSDIRNKSLFLEIIRQPRWVGHELRRMHRYGVLGAYMPQFRAIEGLMQFDLFHVYTVDEHILTLVRNLRHFGVPEKAEEFPLCTQILRTGIPKQELLYLGGLFHDIAKGRGGDHAKLGAEDAYNFCREHLLSEHDARLVAWLVDEHLLMSQTAQREDIDDPEVINRFASRVGDRQRLNYLYLLTVADIRATNPSMWNSWKDALLADLYRKTLLALRRGLENPLDKNERIRETRDAALALMSRKLKNTIDVEALWDTLGDDYFLRHSADEIAWHTQAIADCDNDELPLVLVRPQTERGGTEVFIYMQDRDFIFATTTRVMEQLGLDIHDARIITSSSGFVLDTYIVLEPDGEMIDGRKRGDEISDALHRALLNIDKLPPIKTNRMAERKLRHFHIPTRIEFTSDEPNNRTIMQVSAADRPGLLSRVGVALRFCGARIQGAKIATYGERAEDIFFITDPDTNQPISDTIKFECLRNSISESLQN